VTHSERELMLRAARAYAERRDSPMAADVVAMLENALSDRDRAWLGMGIAIHTPAEREEVAP
jgi:hypothetical protein